MPEEIWTVLFLIVAAGIILLFIWAVKKNMHGEACSCGAKSCTRCSECKNTKK
ncbi:MAG TPA: hypothetical protein O0X69_04760 [Methanocorpusculum sp.]|nr:hypothetical protein [Methanocorpusculum sp.]